MNLLLCGPEENVFFSPVLNKDAHGVWLSKKPTRVGA